ncbi:MAG: hypothetical protein ABFQ65_01515 [Nanoarchaeota archaeon]
MYKKNFSILILLVVFMSFAVTAQVGPGDGTGPLHDEIIATGGQGGEPILGEGRGVMAKPGEYFGQQGQMMQIFQNQGRFSLKVGDSYANCLCNLTQEEFQNRTRLYARTSQGKDFEIKVMPDIASETALERLRLRNCGEDCEIELREVGLGDDARFAYEMKTQRNSKVFGLFGARMNVEAQVDAETGELIRIDKPWWAFVATESEE